MKRVSVVILTWNGCEMLKKFLPSVISHSQGDDVEVCVADNGSKDDTVEMLKRDFPDVRLIMLEKNYGFADGYNKALQRVESQYVVLLNSDVDVRTPWLCPLISYMDAHPNVAACQPKILSYRQPELFEYAGAAGGFIDKNGYPFCRGRIFSTVEKDNHQYDEPISIFWATGAALFIRLEEYRKAGGLDGSFFAHMEEIDLCWRLRSRGHDIVCIPQSVVYHVGGATLQKENPMKTLLNFRNNLVMLYKNTSDEAELKKVMRIRCFWDFVAAMSFVAKGSYANAAAIFKARRQFAERCHRYDEARKQNKEATVVPVIPERYMKSILFQYYLFFKHRFNMLHW